MKIDKPQFKLFLKFLKYLLAYRKKQFLILFLNGLGVLLGLVNPYLSKLVVDKAIINKELKTFIVLGIIGAGVFILNGLIKTMANFLERGIYLRVRFDLNKKIFRHLQGLSWDFFKDKSTGEHMFKINYDIERVVDLIVSIPQELICIFPKLLLTLVIIFYLDWRMAIFSLVLAPILYLPVYYFTSRMQRVWEALLDSSQNIFKHLEEVFSHIYLVKALGKEKKETRNYLKTLISNIKINLKNARLEIIGNFVGGSFNRVVICLITLFGGFEVIRGRITPGTLTAIMLYLAQLIGLQSSIGFFLRRIVLGLVSCQRLDEIFQQKQKIWQATGTTCTSAGRKRLILKEPKIQFKRVSFGYNPQEFILRDLEFSIGKGIVALVGASGCGKTTILNLILGLYEPWEGKILIEGQNIKDLDLFFLKEQIGIALQEPFLWNDTIENNIKYTKEAATREEIIKVAKLTSVDDFVKDLPAGYHTIIGEDACKISEGQKQKIAIARALIKEPKILLLDEAMSSMDSLSEERIITRIKGGPWLHIVIVVSHRLSTVLASDLVYFFRRPDTMVIDRPQELLEKDKVFYNLFAGQIRESALTDTII